MEENKTIFDYLAQIMTIFGFTMLMMNLFCLLFGSSAQPFSALFALGNQGIPAGIAFQLLCISALTVGARFLFFTDRIIRKMPVWLRMICMLIVVILIIAAFVIAFDWFPADMWQPWAMFLLCFGLSFLGSYFVVRIREKMENRKMEEALRRLKETSKF